MSGEEKSEEEERGFTVVDRRGGQEEEASPPPRPAVDFSSLCLSLATSALYHLGVVAHPETGEKIPEPELPAAQQTIDTLEMLEAKTQGNLEDEERKLLESILYELRMHYLEATRASR
jgi:hypothetical protein